MSMSPSINSIQTRKLTARPTPTQKAKIRRNVVFGAARGIGAFRGAGVACRAVNGPTRSGNRSAEASRLKIFQSGHVRRIVFGAELFQEQDTHVREGA
jgi:hypothetical protein